MPYSNKPGLGVLGGSHVLSMARPNRCLSSGFEHLLIEVTFDDSTVWIDPQHETGSVGLIRQELAGGLWIDSSATGTLPEGFGSTHAQ